MNNNIFEYDFDTMVESAYLKLLKKNKNNNIILPDIITEKTPTRIIWKNIENYMNAINRDSNHFYEFIKSQYNNKEINWLSNNKHDGLIIHGKYLKNNDITHILTKYINNYVICNSCKKNDTCMNKINGKKYYFICNNCGMNKNM